jgi:hypothetical protein
MLARRTRQGRIVPAFFSITSKSLPSKHRFASLAFSVLYKSLVSQVLCFHNHLRCRGGCGGHLYFYGSQQKRVTSHVFSRGCRLLCRSLHENLPRFLLFSVAYGLFFAYPGGTHPIGFRRKILTTQRTPRLPARDSSTRRDSAHVRSLHQLSTVK